MMTLGGRLKNVFFPSNICTGVFVLFYFILLLLLFFFAFLLWIFADADLVAERF